MRRRHRFLNSCLTLGTFLAIAACSACDNNGSSSGDSDNSDTDKYEDRLGGNEIAPDIEWLRIEAGSFIFGSPTDSPCRAAMNEDEVPVTLTHPFQIAATELTQAQWESLDLANPSYSTGANKPVTLVNLFDAAAWCNKLSRLEGLEPCYNLESCINRPDSGCISPSRGEHMPGCYHDNVPETVYYCTGDIHKYSDRYSCPGYRLPTAAEWEYAAKAGVTETHTYGGDLHADETLASCSEQPALEDIAWYCNNSGDEVHPVGQKLPNPWGLFDTLGNVAEWTDSPAGPLNEDFSAAPVTDPIGTNYDNTIEYRGQFYRRTGCLLRPSDRSNQSADQRGEIVGFRPVRTIFE